MTLEQIMNVNLRDIDKMTRAELARVVSDARSITRKRIERLEKQEIYTPAYSYIMQSGGIPSVKGMDLITLKNEFKRYKHFLGLKTATVKGAKQYIKQTQQTFEEMTGKKWSYEDLKPFFSMLDDLRDDGLVTTENYKNVLSYMVDYSDKNPGTSKDKIIESARENIYESYEQTTRGFYSSDRF